jgi:hypothetical protein
MLLLRVGFRYSILRDAYVLRGIGERLGPVLKPEGAPPKRAFNGIRSGGAGRAAPRRMSRGKLSEQQQAESRARRRAERESLRQQRPPDDADPRR